MANKLPTLPKHESPALDKIEAAMKAARERQAALKPAAPTQVIPASKDPVQAQLDKARALAAKEEAKAARKAETERKRQEYKAAVAARKAERAAKKEAKLAEVASKKALIGDRKSPEGKAAARMAKVLKKLSPDALAAFDACKDLSPEDAKAVIRALHALNTPIPVKVEAPADAETETETAEEAVEEVAAE